MTPIGEPTKIHGLSATVSSRDHRDPTGCKAGHAANTDLGYGVRDRACVTPGSLTWGKVS